LAKPHRASSTITNECSLTLLSGKDRIMSQSSPLRIAEVAPPAGGCIGITFAPGKKQANAWSGSHDRDLTVDLDAIAAWNAAAVVTLIEPAELKALQIEGLGDEVGHRGMEWFHLPIPDVTAPDAEFDLVWPGTRPVCMPS
jgi:ADP-ribosyl-[dinitrogen reductase] hydrolase